MEGTTWTPLSLGLRRKTNNAFMSFVPTPLKTDTSGWAEIWGCSPQSDGGGTFVLQSFGSAVRDIVWMSDSTVVLALEDQG